MNLDNTFLIENAIAPTARHDQVRLGEFQARSFVAGPGQRSVIWVAGCNRRCPGCMKPDLFSFSAGRWISVSSLSRMILSVAGSEGVTYSGGEPFEQADALAALSRQLKANGLSVAVYTGYRLEALKAQPERFGSLLREVDILIDGEYRRELEGPMRWRGSNNQKVLMLHNGETKECIDTELLQEVQLEVTTERLRLTGFPSDDMEKKLIECFALRGIVLTPESTTEYARPITT
jgi:Organic radical activating enzymes